MVMETRQIKTIFVEVLSLMYILLFVYAAISKLMDFENFEIQVGQSPLLSPYAGIVSWLVPVLELILAFFLSLSRTRYSALWCSVFLMMVFSFYIVVILKFSPYIPCSCGGVLEDMTWKEHLIFNFAFVIAGLIALWFAQKRMVPRKTLLFVSKALVILVVSAALNAWAYLCTQELMVSENPFIRRFPPKAAEFYSHKELAFNSYYLAGSDIAFVYLGNYTAFSHVLRTNPDLSATDTIRIQGSNPEFRLPLRLSVSDKFWLYNGTKPIILQGDKKLWQISKVYYDIPFFTNLEPLDGSWFAFKGNRIGTGETVIGLIEKDGVSRLLDSMIIPFKNGDGIFDMDGTLLFDDTHKQLLYVHRYFNRIIATGRKGNPLYMSRTIDTVSHPGTVVKKLDHEMKMATVPPYVNRRARVAQGLLYVDSALKGRYEDERSSQLSTTIDVYDLSKEAHYLYSFYIPAYKGRKLKDFIISNGFFIALYDSTLVSYHMNGNLKNFDTVKP